MKPLQVIGLGVAVVLLIFVVTFATQYLGQGRGAGQGDVKVVASLGFPERSWPPADTEPDVVPEQEWNTPADHSFWFTNDHDAPVVVGLYGKNCQCTKVEIGLAPEGWDAKRAHAAASAAAIAALAPGAPVSATLPPGEANKPALVPPADVTWHTLVADDPKGFTVPPRRGGWVRLAWKSENLGLRRLAAELWMNAIGAGQTTRLEAGILFVEPIRVTPDTKEMNAGTLAAGDPPMQDVFLFWSSTRDRFSLEVPSAEVQAAKHPFVTVGARPVPLTAAEIAKIQKDHKSKAKCGYRVPVTMAERLPTGRQHDMGPYRTRFELTSDAIDVPLGLSVYGAVRGDVSVVGGGDPKDRDRIHLGTFPGRTGISRPAVLETSAGMMLTLEKFPDFMTVVLKEDPSAGSLDRKIWTLTVTVAPNQANGVFPRQDDERFRDTAIYLKAKPPGDAPERRVRVPVIGTASQK